MEMPPRHAIETARQLQHETLFEVHSEFTKNRVPIVAGLLIVKKVIIKAAPDTEGATDVAYNLLQKRLNDAPNFSLGEHFNRRDRIRLFARSNPYELDQAIIAAEWKAGLTLTSKPVEDGELADHFELV